VQVRARVYPLYQMPNAWIRGRAGSSLPPAGWGERTPDDVCVLLAAVLARPLTTGDGGGLSSLRGCTAGLDPEGSSAWARPGMSGTREGSEAESL
jgi:hypothetical protein